jgi:hypothetical protein
LPKMNPLKRSNARLSPCQKAPEGSAFVDHSGFHYEGHFLDGGDVV